MPEDHDATTDTAANAEQDDAAVPYPDMMSIGKAWLIYTSVRILSFVIPFALVYLALTPWKWEWLVALIAGTLISFLVSQIFLRNARAAIGYSIQQHREARTDTRTRADREEDALLDAAEREANAGHDDR